MLSPERLREPLAHACSRHLGGPARLEGLRRLADGGRTSSSITPDTEAELQRLARDAGVPVAEVRFVLEETDELGQGYVMERLEGETIPRKILRDEPFAKARSRLAHQCGDVLARLHSVAIEALAERLPTMSGGDQLRHYRELHDSFGDPHPVFELAFRFLEERSPDPVQVRLVHGDFRNGNFLVDAAGLRGVLDWELAHLGDPMEDLGWLCVPSWRFGNLDQPVGGFGSRQELFAGYEAQSGEAIDPLRVKWFEIFGTLKWGIMCQLQGFAHLAGRTRSVEKAAIGRRVSETEIDLLDAIESFERG